MEFDTEELILVVLVVGVDILAVIHIIGSLYLTNCCYCFSCCCCCFFYVNVVVVVLLVVVVKYRCKI